MSATLPPSSPGSASASGASDSDDPQRSRSLRRPSESHHAETRCATLTAPAIACHVCLKTCQRAGVSDTSISAESASEQSRRQGDTAAAPPSRSRSTQSCSPHLSARAGTHADCRCLRECDHKTERDLPVMWLEKTSWQVPGLRLRERRAGARPCLRGGGLPQTIHVHHGSSASILLHQLWQVMARL